MGGAAARTKGGAYMTCLAKSNAGAISIESDPSTEVSAQSRRLMPVEKTAAVRQRRAEDTRRWRERLKHGRAILPLEVDETTFDLMEQFDLLSPYKIDD